MKDQSAWVKADGHTWTLASFLIRELSRADEVSPDEFCFILKRLRAEKLFPSFWNAKLPRTRTLDDVLAAGNTEKAQWAVDCICQCDALAEASAAALDMFLASGNPADLDEMIRVGSPFGIPTADALVLRTGCELREAAIAKLPERRLMLLRRFERMRPSPIVPIYPAGGFFDPYLEVMRQVDAEVEPGDLIAAMLSISWYKTPYSIDHTMHGTLAARGFSRFRVQMAA